MKYFYILLTLAFLASCGSAAVTPSETNDEVEAPITAEVNEIIESTLDELNGELGDLDTSSIGEDEESDTDETAWEAMDDTVTANEEVMEAKVVKLEAPYTNPAGPVDMEIEYSLDSDGLIETIEVSATTYDLTDFNASAQKVIGLSLADAADIVVTGGSLTDPAFSAALKEAQ